MELKDEFGLVESYIDCKENKIILRELLEDEKERAEHLFRDGHTCIWEFILALLFDYCE